MDARTRDDPGQYYDSDTDIEDGSDSSTSESVSTGAPCSSSSSEGWMTTHSDADPQPVLACYGSVRSFKSSLDPAYNEQDLGESLESRCQALAAVHSCTLNKLAVKWLDAGFEDKPMPLPPTMVDRASADGLCTYDLSTKNLSYTLCSRGFGKSGRERVLLNNITVEARHGEVLAIMGPSGASKTTLLDALAGRISWKSLSGSILVNGELMTSKFKRVSGYVMQDDAHFPMLTARESLLFGARLRLPSAMSFEEKQRRVDSIIDLLGLGSCADTRIGNEELGGLSGGEIRRVSIATDLIHEPMVLFLDEPTSGLDSTSALQVMESLQRLAKEKSRTVVLTIHQPSYRILDTIDSTVVLAKGAVVYQGHHNDMIKFFTLMGFVKPNHVNVAEFMMDKIEECTASGELEQLQQLAHLAGMDRICDEDEAQLPSMEFREARERRHLSSYDYKVDTRSDVMGRRTMVFQQQDHSRDLESGPAWGNVVTTFANGMPKESWILFQRSFKNATRTPLLFFSRALVFFMTSFILATLFFHSERDWEGVRERQVYFAFTVAILVFTSCEAVPMFLNERGIYMRETSRGAYRASSYVVSSSMTILPFLLLLALLSSMSSYFAVGLVLKATAILVYVFTTFLVLAIANACVACISGLVPNFIASLIIFGAASSYQFLFSGFFVKRDDIPKYWLWLHYGSFFKYAYETLLVNEFKSLPGHVWGDTQTSENVLDMADVDHGAHHQWFNVLYLLCFYVGYRVVFYITLRFRTNNIRH